MQIYKLTTKLASQSHCEERSNRTNTGKKPDIQNEIASSLAMTLLYVHKKTPKKGVFYFFIAIY
jgi:hypothetical protein